VTGRNSYKRWLGLWRIVLNREESAERERLGSMEPPVICHLSASPSKNSLDVLCVLSAGKDEAAWKASKN